MNVSNPADEVLSNPQLAHFVLRFLNFSDATPLRGVSKCVRDTVAEFKFSHVRLTAELPSGWGTDVPAVRGPRNLARWRACFPAADSLALTDGADGPVTNADLERHCHGLRLVSLVNCKRVTNKGIAALWAAYTVCLDYCPRLTGAALRRLHRRAPDVGGAVLFRHCGDGVCDADMAALGGATVLMFVADDETTNSLTPAGLRQLRSVRSMLLTVTQPSPGVAPLLADAAAFAAALPPSLRSLELKFLDAVTLPGGLFVNGAALLELDLVGRDGSELTLHGDTFEGLVRLQRLLISGVQSELPPELLDPVAGTLEALTLFGCGGTDALAAHLAAAPLPRVKELVVHMPETFRAAVALVPGCPALRQLTVTYPAEFLEVHGVTMGVAAAKVLALLPPATSLGGGGWELESNTLHGDDGDGDEPQIVELVLRRRPQDDGDDGDGAAWLAWRAAVAGSGVRL
jgi:hypothetical protein